MSKHRLELLPWDTGLFGFPVGRLTIEQPAAEEVREALDEGRKDGLHLLYCTVPWSDRRARSVLEASGAKLVDHKVKFRKRVGTVVTPGSGLQSVRGETCGPDMDRLALVSGQFSRFRLDPRIDASVYTSLYLTWIRRSLKGELADEVLVVRPNDRGAVAMVTIARSDCTASRAGTASAVIGLVAVDPAMQGQGLGRSLMDGAQAWCADHEIVTLDVVTQGANQAACALYEGTGFSRVEEHAVYHCWLDP
jgi:dTDP-4-amino-4,6-dideoxy-D-galactose acyltransferase